MTSLLHHTVEGPVADDMMSSFPPACCGWRGTCRVGLQLRGGLLRGLGPGGAHSRPCVAAHRSCAGSGPLPRAGAQLPVVCVLLLGGVAGAAAAGLRCMQRCLWRPANRGPPSLASASTSGLSRPVHYQAHFASGPHSGLRRAQRDATRSDRAIFSPRTSGTSGHAATRCGAPEGPHAGVCVAAHGN